MTVDSVIAPDLLNAEIAAIEDLLVHYEDWRAVAQLEARERKGELPANVASSGIKTLLLDKLATNPLFLRRQTLLKEVERLTKQARVEAAVSETDRASEPAEDVDDLTRIRGIDARLERRLNALNIISYAQIAIWEDADVDYFARTLGLDHSIIGEKWIEQAAVLVARQKLAPRKSASSPITRPSLSFRKRPARSLCLRMLRQSKMLRHRLNISRKADNPAPRRLFSIQRVEGRGRTRVHSQALSKSHNFL